MLGERCATLSRGTGLETEAVVAVEAVEGKSSSPTEAIWRVLLYEILDDVYFPRTGLKGIVRQVERDHSIIKTMKETYDHDWFHLAKFNLDEHSVAGLNGLIPARWLDGFDKPIGVIDENG